MLHPEACLECGLYASIKRALVARPAPVDPGTLERLADFVRDLDRVEDPAAEDRTGRRRGEEPSG